MFPFLRTAIVIVFAYIVAKKFSKIIRTDGISETEYLSNTYNSTTSVVRRMANCMFFQKSYTPVAEFIADSLKDEFILLTGGNRGIGLETAVGLVARGAHVVIASRDTTKSKESITYIQNKIPSSSQGKIESVTLDLSDLNQVSEFVTTLSTTYPDKKFTQVIENSGVWPSKYILSPQGYELAYATNVLGHHLLLRKMIESNLLISNPRIIIITGDIYVIAKDCTSNFIYINETNGGGQMAYSRSKICVNWLFNQLHIRYPQYHMYLVHPGVIATELVGKVDTLKKLILLNLTQGAQTTLVCASHQGNLLVNGGYYHNTCGRMLLSSDDVSNNVKRSEETWNEVETIIAPYM